MVDRIALKKYRTERELEMNMKSSFALERADYELGGTGLLTCDLLLSAAPSHPDGQWLRAAVKRSLTVAGQWRILTALPKHLASVLL